MADDIVDRLREVAANIDGKGSALLIGAANEIERLRVLAGCVSNGEVTFTTIKGQAKAVPTHFMVDTYDALGGLRPNG